MATGSRVTVAAGKSPHGASSSVDEATNLVRLFSFSPAEAEQQPELASVVEVLHGAGRRNPA